MGEDGPRRHVAAPCLKRDDSLSKHDWRRRERFDDAAPQALWAQPRQGAASGTGTTRRRRFADGRSRPGYAAPPRSLSLSTARNLARNRVRLRRTFAGTGEGQPRRRLCRVRAVSQWGGGGVVRNRAGETFEHPAPPGRRPGSGRIGACRRSSLASSSSIPTHGRSGGTTSAASFRRRRSRRWRG